MSYNQNDIVSGINHKDKKAWNMVYSQFYAALCAYVAKMIPESEAVEDLVQDVFISIWEKGNTFQTIQELTHYMYRACYNNTLIYIRNNQIHDTILNIIGKELNEEDEDTYICTDCKRRNNTPTVSEYRTTPHRTTPHHAPTNRGTLMGRNSSNVRSQPKYHKNTKKQKLQISAKQIRRLIISRPFLYFILK